MTEQRAELSNATNRSEWWINYYTDKPYIRALLAFVSGAIPIPVLAGVSNLAVELIASGVEDMRRERQRAFFDELASGEHELNDELIQQEEFLHEFFATYSAAVRTRERAKIRRFARLLLTAIRRNRLGGDDIEEFRNILEELSARELEILLILQKCETSHPRQLIEVGGSPKLETDAQHTKRFWDSFQSEVESKLGVRSDIFAPMLTRLARTGLYEPIRDAYLGYTGGRGRLTPRFLEFTRWIEVEADKS